MLGEIVGGLTDATTAEAVVAAVATPELLERIRATADANGMPVGEHVASRIRHIVDHGGEEIWLDLIGAMAGSPQPGAAAIERMMAHAFADPVRVRVTHSGK